MGQFSYKAVNRAGEHATGTIEAADRRSAVASLADKGQFVIELAEEIQSAGRLSAEPNFSPVIHLWQPFRSSPTVGCTAQSRIRRDPVPAAAVRRTPYDENRSRKNITSWNKRA